MIRPFCSELLYVVVDAGGAGDSSGGTGVPTQVQPFVDPATAGVFDTDATRTGSGAASQPYAPLPPPNNSLPGAPLGAVASIFLILCACMHEGGGARAAETMPFMATQVKRAMLTREYRQLPVVERQKAVPCSLTGGAARHVGDGHLQALLHGAVTSTGIA